MGDTAHIREAAAEVALGTLPDEERRSAEAHLLACEECRAEVDSFRPVASRLLALVPGTEPPLGFDRRVLAGVAGPAGYRRKVPRRTMVVAVAAAAAVVFGVAGWLAGRSTSPHRVQQRVAVAELMSAGRDVGQVEASGSPLWLTVSVHDAGISGPVICQVLKSDGSVTDMGTFVLDRGNATWTVPDPGGMAGVTMARLVDPAGSVVAVARFS